MNVRLQDVSATTEQIKAEADKTLRKARRWLFDAREQAASTLWHTHLTVLKRAGELADDAPEAVKDTAKSLLSTVERTTTRPPIADYEDKNVREVMAALRELDAFGLLRVQRHESANKNRKTILDAIVREHDRRARLAELGA